MFKFSGDLKREGNPQNTETSEKARTIPTATQLRKYGVKFQKNDNNSTIISFKDGIMKMPHFNIEDNLSALFCNLIALEQSCAEYGNRCTNSVLFMDHLIDTADDVKLLTKDKIIENDVGSMKKTANLFNDMCRGLVIDISEDEYFDHLYKEINEYCKRPVNKWRTMLMRNYFSNPWSISAFVVASLLLCLAIVQTICSLMEVINEK